MGAFASTPQFVLGFLLLATTIRSTLADTPTPYLNPGFSFNYDKQDQLLPLPLTSQCEAIQLKWGRTGNDTGPNPVAPYFLQVYHSASSTPFRLPQTERPQSWQVPFAPGTQYQICMFDFRGVSGGCQSTYTMIPNTTVTGTPSCGNLTVPQSFAVEAKVPTGLMGQYSYIDQCRSLSVKPLSGQPPYTLTVAPSSHPPYNITTDTMEDIKWEVQLPVGSRFFLSLHTGEGWKWATGPLRVGGNGPMDCLAPDTIRKADADKTLIGASVGGAVLGLLFGVLGCVGFLHLRRKWQRRRAPSKAYANSEYYFGRDSPDRPFRNTTPAPSVMFSTKTSTTRTPTLASMPLSHAPSRRDASNIRLEPVRPGRIPPSGSISRQGSVTTTMTGETVGTRSGDFALLPSSPPPGEFGFGSFNPADPFASSGIVIEDNASLTSSGAHSQYRPQHRRRPPSGLTMLTMAPSYRGPAPSNGDVYVIHETTPADTPPEYGRHVADTSFGPPGTTPQPPQGLEPVLASTIPEESEAASQHRQRPLQPNRI
ncbi:hypothetical protein CVT24_006223 [Panaeolus cyanescens]|uniref:Fibronectin type-III domain-containing protein n=1 Tax=Panaeolus cyanescens TaxID=181874 RepID=A0A409YEH7_9AGAR|nr:hypothetical protein CVT24_006223 [Panaeolus cyanescens]